MQGWPDQAVAKPEDLREYRISPRAIYSRPCRGESLESRIFALE